MSRLLLLVLFLIWMPGPPSAAPTEDAWAALALFAGFFLFQTILLGVWSRALARRAATPSFRQQMRWLQRAVFCARMLIPIWFGVGVWLLEWGAIVGQMGTWGYRSVVGVLIGTLPALLAWMGLWWAQYPAERALREQNILNDLDSDRPLHPPPSFKKYFASNFRLQVLFTLAPVLLVMLVRDAAVFVIMRSKGLPLASEMPSGTETATTLGAAALVFLIAPALLTRVLSTTPMPDSALRRRLQHLCRRAGVRYREILIWNTHFHVGNAAVMGVVPRFRYVLLSDVLLERMSDEQIEAVFAHELGHVVHRHMTWYAIFFAVLIMLVGALLELSEPYARTLGSGMAGGFGTALMTAVFVLAFGALSRRCERQADVFAARMMESLRPQPVSAESKKRPMIVVPSPGAPMSHVGEHGARLFASALGRVAAINNIPITPRSRAAPGLWNHISHAADGLLDMSSNWLHGSVAGRMQYLHDLSADPHLTGHFDRKMFWMYCTILAALFVSAFMSVLAMSMTPAAPGM